MCDSRYSRGGGPSHSSLDGAFMEAVDNHASGEDPVVRDFDSFEEFSAWLFKGL